MQSQQPLRWGIVGTGLIARTFATDLALTDSGVVGAVGSRSQESADRFADSLGVSTRHSSYESLVSDPDVDAVYVATPHPMHRDSALLAIQAGKPVLVEKPFTMSATQAEELVAAAAVADVLLMEAMWTRFLPHMAEVRRLLEDGALGEMVTVTADHGQWFPRDPEFRLFAPELGGGALLDLGVYPISFASMVLGTPARVVALSSPTFTGVDGQTSILMGYEGGAQAVLNCTSSAVSETRASIVGTEARIEIDGVWYAPTTFTLIPREGASVRYDEPHAGHGLRHEADHFAWCLQNGLTESPLLPLAETVSIMRTMDAVLASA
ncbi:MAG TPA: Gfo/Idh/MocA family oxidoreductase [Jatrophihabitans sp.]|jgi:predicted dehydrogenase